MYLCSFMFIVYVYASRHRRIVWFASTCLHVVFAVGLNRLGVNMHTEHVFRWMGFTFSWLKYPPDEVIPLINIREGWWQFMTG